jgi:TonB family protein
MAKSVFLLVVSLLGTIQYSYSQAPIKQLTPKLAIETFNYVKSSGIMISPAEMTQFMFEDLKKENDFKLTFLPPDYDAKVLNDFDIIIGGNYELLDNQVSVEYEIRMVAMKARTKAKLTKMELADIKKEIFNTLTNLFVNIHITSQPELCELEIDGIAYGTTPITIERMLAGNHLIHLIKQGYLGLFQEVEFTRTDTLNLKLVEELSSSAIPPEPNGGIQEIIQRIKYPADTKYQGVEGEVWILVGINEKGNVTTTEIKKSQGRQDIDQAVITAIKSTKWKPAMINNQPIEGSTQIKIKFSK